MNNGEFLLSGLIYITRAHTNYNSSRLDQYGVGILI
jgi:hypothetical protein